MTILPHPVTTILVVKDNTNAAAHIGVSPATLATWRCTQEVRIPFARIGRRVVYRIKDLDDFLSTQVDKTRGDA